VFISNYLQIKIRLKYHCTMINDIAIILKDIKLHSADMQRCDK